VSPVSVKGVTRSDVLQAQALVCSDTLGTKRTGLEVR
jgi:hypothetical protein